MFRHPLVEKPRGLTTWDARSRKVMGRMFRNVSSPLPGANDMPNVCCTKDHIASSLTDKMGEGWGTCQAETALISLLACSGKLLLLNQTFSLSSFWVRVTDTTFADAELETTWNLPGNRKRLTPHFLVHRLLWDWGNASGLAQTFKTNPYRLPCGLTHWPLVSRMRVSHGFYSYSYLIAIYCYSKCSYNSKYTDQLKEYCIAVKLMDSGARWPRIKPHLYQLPALWSGENYMFLCFCFLIYKQD